MRSDLPPKLHASAAGQTEIPGIIFGIFRSVRPGRVHKAADRNKLKLTDKGNGKYTFTMPASSVTVTATFMDDNTMLNFFVDVKAGDYCCDAVLWAAQTGITSGTDAVHFSPDQPCTRAQIVTFLYRTLEK